jgi:hypothetical protein
VTIKQGLRQNLGQFVILIVVNAFVGAMIGLEQTVVPLIGKNEFGIDSNAIILSFSTFTPARLQSDGEGKRS